MMEKAPKALRLHLALMGRVNSGKSSFLNLVAGQNVSITSAQEGTTTDVVEKAQELLPLGPVVWLDTAGYGDKTGLAAARLGKTKSVWERADVIVLVCEGNQIGEEEQRIIDEAAARKLPLIKIFNKADILPHEGDGIAVNSTDLSSRNDVLNRLKAELLKVCPEDFINPPFSVPASVTPRCRGYSIFCAIERYASIVVKTSEDLSDTFIMSKSKSSRIWICFIALLTIFSDSGIFSSRSSFSSEPALTPILIGIFCCFASETTFSTFSRFPMFPGFKRSALIPLFIHCIASL